ncbi:uncharacterized protein K452DRAFT_288763 [Aplosporella prunicola CBS 121167]|uniref:GP-PDE domain-containing protein n=1 Tax=Aplosporella prunicola CBS 121167 TaxID=1176127 RepID=A0A6A6BCQ6_9PEZI|nr:uncharacterized protein K452DRAFT_288763 [Aplosporella prunicola CBS 121167]KAF2140667.1 hypothetical protein K452DRAFT_288763 [Aplosporella prunicola CBS 121167]
MEQQQLLPKSETFPNPTFTLARYDTKHGRPLPQAIAHRGYKAKYPENSMAAFTGAVEVGAHAVETDVHLTRDGVVVLSHDATLKRCFGRPEKVLDCDWEYVATLRTLEEPHAPMARLTDLLAYLAQPGLEHIWVLLDIKKDNNLDQVMRLIAETIAAVPASPERPWNQRIVIGAWAAKYLGPISTHLPTFPITHITVSPLNTCPFLRTPYASFNMFLPMLMGPLGAAFRRKARSLRRPVYAWTVNRESWMRWAITHALDGVVTDELERFLDVCRRWEDQLEGLEPGEERRSCLGLLCFG